MSPEKKKPNPAPPGDTVPSDSPRETATAEALRMCLRREIEAEVRKDFDRRVEEEVRRRVDALALAGVHPLKADDMIAGGHLTRPIVPGSVYERWDRPQRIQHLLLMISFIVLAVTGFALLVPTPQKIASSLEWLFNLRGLLHRLAAVVMTGTSVYHVVYVLFTTRGKQEMVAMMPQPKQDVTAFVHAMRYLLGWTDTPPPNGRFNYAEKFEYWALVWGTIVMTVTGILLWSVANWPRFVIDLSMAIHKYEAILAVLAILFWHVYMVHMRPGVFPMSRVWWDGTISAHELKEDHLLEWEAIRNQESA